jgi:hypothetical protein
MHKFKKGGVFMECIINDRVLIVPEGTVKIGFKDISNYIYNDSIEEILLPSTLEFIEDNTFFDFTEIKKINIPKSVIEIGTQAFWGIDQIEELVIPSTVKRIKKRAFCNLPQCKLIIVGESSTIPDRWDREFAVNVKELCFVPKL